MTALQTFHASLIDPAEAKARRVAAAAQQAPIVLVQTVDAIVEGCNNIKRLLDVDPAVSEKLAERDPNLPDEILDARQRMCDLVQLLLPGAAERIIK